MTFPGSPRRCAAITSSHFAECARCSARQKFHRSLDVTLAVLTATAALFFLFALAVLEAHQAAGACRLQDSGPRYLRHVPHADFGRNRRALLLADRHGTGADGHACASYLGGIAAERARLIEQRVRGHQFAASSLNRTEASNQKASRCGRPFRVCGIPSPLCARRSAEKRNGDSV